MMGPHKSTGWSCSFSRPWFLPAVCLLDFLSVFLLKVVEKLHSKQISVESEKTLYCVTAGI